MNYILCIETLLYYICLILITHQLLEKELKHRTALYLSLVTLSLFLVFIAHIKSQLFYGLYIFAQIAMIVLVKILFSNTSLFTVIFTYILIFSINALFIAPLTSFLPWDIFIDFTFHILSSSVYIFICTSKVKNTLRLLIKQVPTAIKRLVTLVLLFEVVLLMIFFESSFFISYSLWYNFVQTTIILFIVALTIVLPILISTSITNNTLKQLTRQYEQQIAAQAEHYKRLAASQAELRRFRHDFHNTRVAVETLLRQGDTDGALALLTDDRDALCAAALPFDTGNGIADALLTDKQQRAASSGIILTFDGLLPSEGLSPADICILLGNTLDNAIEACEALPVTCDRHITVTAHGGSGFLFLSVTNPVAAKVAIEYDRIPTTKADKTLHGFGLQSLHAAAKRYDGRVALSCTDELFTADIDLCLMPSVSQTASLSLR